jgi:hypothetical protein
MASALRAGSDIFSRMFSMSSDQDLVTFDAEGCKILSRSGTVSLTGSMKP